MALLGFKKRFVPFIEEGSKTHTIRSDRKRNPRVGEMLHCYSNPRQKSMKLIFRVPCVRVDPIKIEVTDGTPTVNLAEIELSPEETKAFFWRDGFRETGDSLAEAVSFWKARLPFEGVVIHKDFKRRSM